MQVREHTNLLSIFAWIYAGLQGIFALLYLLIVLIYGISGVFIAFNAKSSDAAAIAIIGVVTMLFLGICIVGLVSMIANIRMGKRLRGDKPPTQRTMIVTAILNFLSWICGGILLMPFGIALGVYGLWFTLSDTGKAYLSGQAYSPAYAYPPNPQLYQVSQPAGVQMPDTQESYKWR